MTSISENERPVIRLVIEHLMDAIDGERVDWRYIEINPYYIVLALIFLRRLEDEYDGS